MLAPHEMVTLLCAAQRSRSAAIFSGAAFTDAKDVTLKIVGCIVQLDPIATVPALLMISFKERTIAGEFLANA
jgi:hypothetical protein